MAVPHRTRGMVACLVRDEAGDEPAPGWLETLARACSPRVEPHGVEAVLFDAEGLSRVCGPPEVIARDVQALAASQSVAVRSTPVEHHTIPDDGGPTNDTTRIVPC